MGRLIAGVRSAGALRREERVVAGRVGGVVWVIASLSVIAMAVVLPADQVHRTTLVAMGLGGCLWGTFSGAVLDYSRLPVWLIHLSAFAGTVAIAVAMAISGGARSPAWACLLYVVVFAAYFFTPTAAAAYFLACVAAAAIVLLGSSGTTRSEGAGALVVAAPAFIFLGAAIVAGKHFIWGLQRRAERLAAEQGALRRVATAVVSGEPADRFHQIVALEAGHLLTGSGAAILRLDGPSHAVILGSWAEQPERQYEVGARFPVPPRSEVAKALAAGLPVRIDRQPPDGDIGRLGYRSSIISPIKMDAQTWGFLVVVSLTMDGLTAEHERRLSEFSELIAASVTNIEDRARLAAQAATDPLTGVANHRTFYERLGGDLARARRFGTPVSVAMIDVDHFKLVNDFGGHEAGDEVLIAVARCLSDAARAVDTLARIGGDEFAWILPQTTAAEARVAVERARRRITTPDGQRLKVTMSAGICDSSWTADAGELVRLADRALYLSKEHGRDQVRVYAPSSADELAAG
jgi:diguanylate cyclase (GGDEF)-like protein